MQINLLPFREQSKTIKKKRFLRLIMGIGSIFLLLFLIIYIILFIKDSKQLRLNTFLQDEINKEQASLAALQTGENNEKTIVKKLSLIAGFYYNNFRVVRALNELPKLTPDTIYLTAIERQGINYFLTGYGKTDNDITTYMVTLEKSPYFAQPKIASLNSSANKQIKDLHLFKLQVPQEGY